MRGPASAGPRPDVQERAIKLVASQEKFDAKTSDAFRAFVAKYRFEGNQDVNIETLVAEFRKANGPNANVGLKELAMALWTPSRRKPSAG